MGRSVEPTSVVGAEEGKQLVAIGLPAQRLLARKDKRDRPLHGHRGETPTRAVTCVLRTAQSATSEH